MKPRLTALLLVVAALMVSCRSDEIALTYRFPEGATFRYRMEVQASAQWRLAQGGSGSYEAVFNVTERVESLEDDGAIISVRLDPIDIREIGRLPAPGLEGRDFELRVGHHGEVLEVIEVDGVPAAELPAGQLVFIGTYRPPLPLDAVGLRDEWRARQALAEPASQETRTQGELNELNRDEDGRIARLSYDGEGVISWNSRLAQGSARLDGTTESQSEAVLDIDGGFLRAADSTTTGSFDVRFSPGGEGTAQTGTLELRLRLRVEKTG